jgi:hypothetical protein
MDSRSSGAGTQQQVPHDLAVLLRTLQATDDPMFNTALVAARIKGWKPPVLANVLQMKPAAVSKRIERAQRRQDAAEAAAEVLAAAEAAEGVDQAPLRRLVDEQRQLTEQMQKLVIPVPEPAGAMDDGRQPVPDWIAELRAMQQVARKVNGAMPVGHPSRRVSERFSAELNRLIKEEGFTPSYLAQVLQISHRAVTSRLERHSMRAPCPSVAGTASGRYFGRKIGDPGQGAPRLTRDQRAELRNLWLRYHEVVAKGAREGRRLALAAKLREYIEQGFTLANLAQTMNTQDMRVRYGELRTVLAGVPAEEGVR